LVGWCAAIELMTLPISHRDTSITDFIVPLAIGCLGVYIAKPLIQFLSRIDSSLSWLLAGITWSFVILIGFTIRYKQFVTAPEEQLNRLRDIWVVPFARAQRSSEFEAMENILLKLLVFALLAFFLSGWHDRSKHMKTKLSALRENGQLLVAIVWIATLGLSVELAQVFLVPLVPDVTDIFLYLCGAVFGAIGFWMLIPKQAKRS